jgi:flagellar biosynthesis protein FliQ
MLGRNMKTKKIVGLILKIPLYALVLGSFVASIYAAYAKIQGVTYATPVILAVIIIAFIIGSYLRREPKIEEVKKYQEQQ